MSFNGFQSKSSLELKGSTFNAAAINGVYATHAELKNNTADQPELYLYGVQVGGDLDLSGLTGLTRDIELSNSSVGGNLWLGGTVIGGQDKKGRRFGGTIRMAGTDVRRNLVTLWSHAKEIHAEDATVGGTFKASSGCTGLITLSGSTVGRLEILDDSSSHCTSPTDLQAADVKVRQNVVILDVAIGAIGLDGAKVEGDVDLWASKIRSIDAFNMRVDGQLTMGADVAGDTRLAGAEVHDHAYIGFAPGRDKSPPQATHYHGRLQADDMVVGGSLFLNGGRYDEAPRIVRAKVNGNLDLKGAVAPGFDLSGSRIVGDIRLWPTPGSGTLSARDVEAAAIAEGAAVGPTPGCGSLPHIIFTGLHYRGLSAFDSNGDDLLDRPARWLTCMLAAQADFTFQPYRELAASLRSAGFPDKADDVLVAANRRELFEAVQQGRLFVIARSLLLYITIGWGIGAGYLHAFVCALFLTFLGAAMLRGRAHAPNGAERSLGWCLIASLSRFLPVKVGSDIDDYFSKDGVNELGRARKAYFILHAVLGFFIGACIAAGLSGFTQSVS